MYDWKNNKKKRLTSLDFIGTYFLFFLYISWIYGMMMLAGGVLKYLASPRSFSLLLQEYAPHC